MAKKKRVLKKTSRKVLKARKKRAYQGRSPSGKPKHSKVAKLMRLAKARSRKSSKKVRIKSKKKRR
ncbi:MAG: hypothetical protein Q8R47_02785 [Nanoarchaeota archaeon]|nr:hypothetical protein [Nanoarchaeota archaeon]